jgi:hypothetical protein
MTLNRTSTVAGLERLSLSQKVLLNATNVRIHFNQSLTTNLAGNLFFGASVGDGTHTLYYVLSDEATQQTVRTYAANTTIIIPTARSQWSTITLSPQPYWSVQGWAAPQQVTFTVLLESNVSGVYYASFDSITPF